MADCDDYEVIAAWGLAHAAFLGDVIENAFAVATGGDTSIEYDKCRGEKHDDR